MMAQNVACHECHMSPDKHLWELNSSVQLPQLLLSVLKQMPSVTAVNNFKFIVRMFNVKWTLYKIYTWSPLWCGVTPEHRPHTTLDTPLINTTKHLPCCLQTNFKKFQMKTEIEWPNVSMEVVCSSHCGDRNKSNRGWETPTEREKEHQLAAKRDR